MRKNLLLLLLLLTLLLASCAGAPPAEQDPHLPLPPGGPLRVFPVASVEGGAFSAAEICYALAGQSVEIYPVLQYGDVYYSQAGSFYLDEDTLIKAAPLPDATFGWQRVLPVLKADGYDNFSSDRLYMEEVEYSFQWLASGAALAIDELSPGTCYIQLSDGKTQYAGNFSTAEPIYLRDSIIQIVCRADNSYVGYLQELLGTPFIMYPKHTFNKVHQTDARVGSDCAELAIYGRRRMGEDIPYVGPEKIRKYLYALLDGRIAIFNDGFVYDIFGADVPVSKDGIQTGDIFHYGSQVAVFYADTGIIGKIDGEDILLQSYGASPYFTTVAENDALFGAATIYRWK